MGHEAVAVHSFHSSGDQRGQFGRFFAPPLYIGKIAARHGLYHIVACGNGDQFSNHQLRVWTYSVTMAELVGEAGRQY